ncbi:MAG: hypothetical protein JO250_22750 [Armatimonadetes bacterium]|nr:hypothetical protein [Armatimonadota bacterium]
MTSDPLAKALATIEARKEQSACEAENAIPIGDAVQQLDFDATPEEIWAEVQMQRARSRRGHRRRKAALFAACAMLVSAGSFITYDLTTAKASQRVETATTPLSTLARNIVVQDAVPAGSVLRTLSEVPDDHTVRCSADNLIALGEYANRRMEDADWQRLRHSVGNHEAMPWRIVRYGNDVYLRGWVAQRLTPKAARLGGVALYDTPLARELGPRPVPITFRITTRALDLDPPTMERQEVIGGERLTISDLSDLRLDRHAWEKW